MPDNTDNESHELVVYRLQKAETDIVKLEERLTIFIAKEDARETKKLLWGITTLGGAVMILGGVLWQYRPVIFSE